MSEVSWIGGHPPGVLSIPSRHGALPSPAQLHREIGTRIGLVKSITERVKVNTLRSYILGTLHDTREEGQLNSAFSPDKQNLS